MTIRMLDDEHRIVTYRVVEAEDREVRVGAYHEFSVNGGRGWTGYRGHEFERTVRLFGRNLEKRLDRAERKVVAELENLLQRIKRVEQASSASGDAGMGG